MKNKSIKKTLIWVLKTVLAGISAIIILSVIAYFYNYTGTHITNTTKATDYIWMPNQKINNMKEGFASIKIDENGFNNLHSPDRTVDILLMGSSHMEAYQVKQEQNCGFLLNEYLPEYYTYNIGISGHTIYRIVDNIDSALKEFTPSKYVFIETNTVQLNCNTMNSVLAEEADYIKSYDSGILFYLQKIPAFKPLYNQFDNWIKIKPTTTKSTNSKHYETVITDEYTSTIYNFLNIIKTTADEHGITPVIFYAPNEELSSDGNLIFQTDEKYFKVYKDTCESLGIVFLDMSDSFYDLYKKEKKLAHGFPNTAVGVGHLNKYGHEIIAESLAYKIHKLEGR